MSIFVCLGSIYTKKKKVQKSGILYFSKSFVIFSMPYQAYEKLNLKILHYVK